jgi:hypothetical protein
MKAGNLTIKWYHTFITDTVPSASAGRFFTSCSLSKDSETHIAHATCAPNDHFCKETGRKLSLARVMKNANLPKEERTVVWEIYRNMTPNKRW